MSLGIIGNAFAEDIPEDIMKIININAEKEYSQLPFLKEEFIENEIKAYKDVKNFKDPTVPKKVVDSAMERAIIYFPYYYGVQKAFIKRELKYYKKIIHYNNTAIINDIIVPDNIIDKMIERGIKTHPFNPRSRRTLTANEMRCYKEIKSFNDPAVPKSIAYKIIKKAAEKFPYKYGLQ